MIQNTVIQATSDAVSTKQPFETYNHKFVIVGTDALATTEEADLFVKQGNTWVTLTDLTGTAVKLTASIQSITLDGGPEYAATKDATAGACGVYVTRGPMNT